ncbi:bifunctional diguanylate cyclase/phosphodiesterase [Salinisphaera hydrothermalis]|uniref:Diguanylate cyclase n=1 Tax=Salinisphaera hydrothermalis (strain C41B8) TaxID=1304275 RepID=A0A084II33_SALHC|nr:bifunctional diguanylate cyclase/phosphodiesterase [Salinisphaera hydrothermalis]KEZ76367.1 diguanylate cyclase [Salinisphaera hydrothermalis C41B8]
MDRLAQHIDYAFQPIVSINSGRCYGVEALMRGWNQTGLASIDAVLDFAHTHDLLIETDALLKRLAFEKFSRVPFSRHLRLFFNIDNRLFNSAAYNPKRTVWALEQYNLHPSSVVLEVSERNHLNRDAGSYRVLEKYRDSTIRMALDDFGTGFSGLSLLFDTNPEYVKIDRYFISDIGANHRKKVFVSHVVSLAKTLGISVVAEGVETAAEFYTCREIGCDLVQGYLIQRPTRDLADLRPDYPAVLELRAADRRKKQDRVKSVHEQLDLAPALDVGMRMEDILDAFRRHPERSFFPFLDDNRHPLGMIRETELKEYIYSPYGRQLLSRKGRDEYLELFLRRCPIADVHTGIDLILEQYAMSPSRDGVLITDDGAYLGVLSAEALVLAVQERNLELARDQNPLTKLPGNPSIERLINELENTDQSVALLYFDLDNFKVFNDAYGFRLGDRVLRMFAEILQKHFAVLGAFIGHIGGDDFFVATRDETYDEVARTAERVLDGFRFSVQSLYTDADRQAGFLVGLDRRGRPTEFPLLSASCALLAVAPGRSDRTEYTFLSVITQLKEAAKHGGNAVVAASVL